MDTLNLKLRLLTLRMALPVRKNYLQTPSKYLPSTYRTTSQHPQDTLQTILGHFWDNFLKFLHVSRPLKIMKIGPLPFKLLKMICNPLIKRGTSLQDVFATFPYCVSSLYYSLPASSGMDHSLLKYSACLPLKYYQHYGQNITPSPSSS